MKLERLTSVQPDDFMCPLQPGEVIDRQRKVTPNKQASSSQSRNEEPITERRQCEAAILA